MLMNDFAPNLTEAHAKTVEMPTVIALSLVEVRRVELLYVCSCVNKSTIK